MKKPDKRSGDAGHRDKAGDGKLRRADPVVDEAIGRQLKRLYEDMASEPVPDRFAELLQKLEQQNGSE